MGKASGTVAALSEQMKASSVTQAISVALILLAIPVYAVYEIFTKFAAEGVHTGPASNNAGMYPLFIALVMIVLVLLQIGRALRDYRRQTAGRAGPPTALSTGRIIALAAEYRRTLLLFALFIVYIAVFGVLGFSVSTMLFIVLSQLILGARSLLKIGLFAALVTSAVWLVFAKVLHLVLPYGTLFE